MITRNRGQFVPISAMIMFSLVMFLVAMLNVYKITRTKLKLQNLADAAALNLASQQAQAFNLVTDRNEWLNNMVAGIPSPSKTDVPEIRDCSFFTANRVLALPGISCIENPYTPDPKKDPRVLSRHIFNSRDGAINYALVVHTINEAQKLFVQAFNSFLGADGRASASSSVMNGPSSFKELLKLDIPEFAKDPSIRLITWNQGGEPTERDVKEAVEGMSDADNMRPYNMQPMNFTVDHDIRTVYLVDNALPQSKTFSELLYGSVDYDAKKSKYGRNGPLRGQTPLDPNGVGWLIPDWKKMPQISIKKQGQSNRVGVGVYVTKNVKLPVVGQTTVMAKAKAYIVNDSGTNTEVGGSGGVPRFLPTYWVKLAN